MISDPKTTPDSRWGRILFAALVAFLGWYITFRMFRTNGLLWSLVLLSPVVPLIDLALPGARYSWAERIRAPKREKPRFAADPALSSQS